MADGDEQDGVYNWLLWFLRRLVQWAAFAVAGCGTLLIFWFHWGNAYKEYGVKVYDPATAGSCYAPLVSTTVAAVNTLAKVKALCSAGNSDGQNALVKNKCTYADTMCAGQTFAASGTGKCAWTDPAGKGVYCETDATTWCRVKCVGTCVSTEAPMNANNGWDCGPLSDNNQDWRRIFTFTPDEFLDMFTPIALGAIEFLQHVGPDYQNAMISGTWVVRALWLFILSLFAQFGYAGDLGVLLGYSVDFCCVLPCVALAILDHQSDEEGRSITTADLVPTIKWLLALCNLDGLCPGLTNVKSRTVGTGTSSGGDEQQASA